MMLAKKDETWCVSLCHTLCEMRQSSSFSDVIIQADGDNVLKAHTCVLAAASPVLKTQLLLSQHYLYIPKISKCMWEVLLQFIYTGNLEIPQPSEIPGILKAGKRLQLTRLTSLCEDLLKDKGGAQVKEPRNIIVETETSQAEFDNDWVSNYGEQDECAQVKETRNVKTETSEGEFDDDCVSSNISQVNTEPEETEPLSENTEVDNSKDNSMDGISQLVANIDGTETASMKADKQPTCEICGKTFRHPSALRGHMFMHTGERPYRCSKCGLTFTFISNLSRHKTIHTGAKSYACTLCGKAFQRRDTQRRHEKVAHSDEKPHTCPQCGKAFKLKNDIVMHMRTHLDDKPFVCEICGKTFSRMPYLVTHRCTHTDARPFQCPNCPKKFKDKSGVTRHQLTHSKLKWHMCPTCGKMFRSKVQFIEHEYCHNGIQRPPPRYQCLVCGKAFTNNSHLKRHTRNIHERAKLCRSVPPIKQDVLDDQTLTLQSWEEKH